MSKIGYTLPVFACASALAGFYYLQEKIARKSVSLSLINPDERVNIPIEQVALIDNRTALAITLSDSGDHLDITDHTPVWAKVTIWEQKSSSSFAEKEKISIKGGEGVGKQLNKQGESAIYSYAKSLLNYHLLPLLKPDEKLEITLILPEGRQLAKRTSNESFGIVEGLSLLGTTGIVQPLTSPKQLEIYQQELKQKLEHSKSLIFCIGENGLDLVQQLNISPNKVIKTANWVGSLLVESALNGIESILLFGYHGKLIKLAGNIFHTHHHLADARQEIFTAHCVKIGVTIDRLQLLLQEETIESSRQLLHQWTPQQCEQVYQSIAETIDHNSQNYIFRHSTRHVTVGCVLFDRKRKIIQKSSNGTVLLDQFML